MIQELLGGNSGGGERNKVLSMNNNNIATTTTATVVVPRHHSSPSPSSSSVASGSVAEEMKKNNNNNKLRCPRCDSANTKFCYYNNYNLTQPRHFCKTCRRYWTKGGALRNVPIGGGCRKNKTPAAAVVVPKLKIPAPEFGPGGGLAGIDPFGLLSHSQQGPSPVLWGSPQSSHLLALLRSSATPNPNPSPSPSSPSDPLKVKEEGAPFGGSHGGGSESAAANLCRSLGMDAPTPLGLWRSNKQPATTTTHPSVQYGHQVGFTLNDHHRSNGDSGIQELYQRLRSSSSPGNISFYNNNNNDSDQTAMVLSTTHHHVGSTYSSHLESPPVNGGGGGGGSGFGGGGEFGFWNNGSGFSWSDLQQTTAATTNGAYP